MDILSLSRFVTKSLCFQNWLIGKLWWCDLQFKYTWLAVCEQSFSFFLKQFLNSVLLKPETEWVFYYPKRRKRFTSYKFFLTQCRYIKPYCAPSIIWKRKKLSFRTSCASTSVLKAPLFFLPWVCTCFFPQTSITQVSVYLIQYDCNARSVWM